jgi:guanylate kinase
MEGKVLLKEMDLQGMASIAHNHKEIYDDTLRIFITLSDEVMISRITTRAPISDEELHKRLITAAGEREQAKIYASHIVNGE